MSALEQAVVERSAISKGLAGSHLAPVACVRNVDEASAANEYIYRMFLVLNFWSPRWNTGGVAEDISLHVLLIIDALDHLLHAWLANWLTLVAERANGDTVTDE